MRPLLLVCAILACLLFASLASCGASSIDSDHGSAMSSFIEADIAMYGEPTEGASQTRDPTKARPAGSVQHGGRKFIRGPNFRKGAADGSTLPPYDPFAIRWRHEKKMERQQARRNEQVKKENDRQNCIRLKKLAKRRREIEKREAEEAKREAEREAAKIKKLTQVETDLLEVDGTALVEAESEAETDAESESELDSESNAESEVDADQLSELNVEAELDTEAESDAEGEAQLDAEEQADDFAEMEADVENGAEADMDIESEYEAELTAAAVATPTADRSLVEQNQGEVTPLVHRNIRKRLQPSSHVTYDRESLAEEKFDNADSRAVFARRARGREIVRFQRLATSAAGQAVVNGVTRTPCGKEITDKGLFGAVISANPGPTVEAANPEAPVMKDQNIPVVKKLPVVPQFKEEASPDEYGDM